ncbi:methyltransferase domain-containing protein [Candidatus Woesearchaeota archaeon]|nr:methyltransferase domain-containing protein [Candidatus Woesearchaeota archaeon]
MKKRLLRYLCCPECKADFKLEVREEKQGEVGKGVLICLKCGKKYPISHGVPVILNDKKLKDFSKTKKNWENWWKKVRKKSDIDVYDRLWNKALKNLGGEPLYREEHFKGKVVLDAGCGTGRYIKSDFSKYGCKEIIGVDLGRQVFEAKRTNNAPNTHFIQADLMNLPFKKKVFDVVTSHGVLHHTPDPKKTFCRLAKNLKIGGMMAVYVYHKEWAYFKAHKKSVFLDALYAVGVSTWLGIRKLVSRMPHQVIKAFAYLMAVKATIESGLGKSRITSPLGKLVKFIPPFAYLGINFHERLVRNYDHYSATFNYFQSIEEVVDWFRIACFNNLEVTSVPVSIRATKKARQTSPLNIKEYKIIGHFDFRKEWEKVHARRRARGL